MKPSLNVVNETIQKIHAPTFNFRQPAVHLCNAGYRDS